MKAFFPVLCGFMLLSAGCGTGDDTRHHSAGVQVLGTPGRGGAGQRTLSSTSITYTYDIATPATQLEPSQPISSDPYTGVRIISVGSIVYREYRYVYWPIGWIDATDAYTGLQLESFEASALIEDATDLFNERFAFAYVPVSEETYVSSATEEGVAASNPPPAPPPPPPPPPRTSGSRGTKKYSWGEVKAMYH